MLTALHHQAAAQIPAPTPTPIATENPLITELRIFRTNLVEAIIHGDTNRQFDFVHTNIVVTWQNNVVARGHQGLRDFYGRVGKDASFKGYTELPTLDDGPLLYGNDTAVAVGHSAGNYELFGRPFEFKNRWTATLVKENGRWQVAAYHVSLDALNNPLINAAKRSLFVAGGIAGAIGLGLGILIGRSLRSHPAGAATR